MGYKIDSPDEELLAASHFKPTWVNENLAGDYDLAVNLNVGGSYFSLTRGMIRSHPDSYFAKIIAEPWKVNDDKPIAVDRDGVLFIHILDFLRGWNDNFTHKSVEWILSLRHEGDFYNIAALMKHCDICGTNKLMDWCWSTLPKSRPTQACKCNSQCTDSSRRE